MKISSSAQLASPVLGSFMDVRWNVLGGLDACTHALARAHSQPKLSSDYPTGLRLVKGVTLRAPRDSQKGEKRPDAGSRPAAGKDGGKKTSSCLQKAADWSPRSRSF